MWALDEKHRKVKNTEIKQISCRRFNPRRWYIFVSFNNSLYVLDTKACWKILIYEQKFLM